jgi:uncharacterized protein YndB with AHSA1/START domain
MPHIRHSIQIDAEPDRVFPLVSAGRGFSQWWASDVTEARPDGTIDLGFFNRATVDRLKPVSIASPRDAAWLCESGKEWAGTKLRFELTRKGSGTMLAFTHADWQSETEYFIACNTTWDGLMFRLKSAAEGKSSGRLFSATGMAY